MIVISQCPCCSKQLSIEIVLGKVTLIDMPVAQPTTPPTGLRKLTEEDRKTIVQSYLTWKASGNWTMDRKRELGHKLGISIGQIAAVTAWCHTNLGGSRYSKKYNLV
jgi:hypothetical protein